MRYLQNITPGKLEEFLGGTQHTVVLGWDATTKALHTLLDWCAVNGDRIDRWMDVGYLSFDRSVL